MTLKPIVHEIRIQNQVIFLDPPIEYARSTWLKQLHDWLGTIFFPGLCAYSCSDSLQVWSVDCVVYKALVMRLGYRCREFRQFRRHIYRLYAALPLRESRTVN